MKISKTAFNALKTGISILVSIATLVGFFCLFSLATIPTGSMIPTLQINEMCVVQKTQKVNRGDIVIFYPHANNPERYAKRVIAMGGDTIAIHDGVVILNGKPLDEPYLRDGYTQTEMEELTVPEGHFFAMGDNRNNSIDSRYYGSFPCDRLVGKVVFHF